jgi:Mrp family chromosome partitioning ATPase
MIIVVGIEKGGVGKSTISSNLAVYRAKQNKKVALRSCLVNKISVKSTLFFEG